MELELLPAGVDAHGDRLVRHRVQQRRLVVGRNTLVPADLAGAGGRPLGAAAAVRPLEGVVRLGREAAVAGDVVESRVRVSPEASVAPGLAINELLFGQRNKFAGA